VITRAQRRGQSHRHFKIFDRAIQIAGGAARLAAIQIGVRIIGIDTNCAIVFGNRPDDVVPAKTLETLLNMLLCGLWLLGRRGEGNCDQETNCDQEQAFHFIQRRLRACDSRAFRPFEGA